MREIEGIAEQPEIPVLENDDDFSFEKQPKGPRYWMGDAPTECQIGKEPITDFFVDGKTRQGPWGFMCATCHSRYGYGLGTGKGQSYRKQSDARWLKVGG